MKLNYSNYEILYSGIIVIIIGIALIITQIVNYGLSYFCLFSILIIITGILKMHFDSKDSKQIFNFRKQILMITVLNANITQNLLMEFKQFVNF